MILTVFAVILFTVVVQGTTLGPLARLFPVRHFAFGPAAATLSETEARLYLLDVQASAARTVLGGDADTRFARRAERIRSHVTDSTATDDASAADRAAIEAGRKALLAMYRGGRIGDMVMGSLETELDVESNAAPAVTRSATPTKRS